TLTKFLGASRALPRIPRLLHQLYQRDDGGTITGFSAQLIQQARRPLQFLEVSRKRSRVQLFKHGLIWAKKNRGRLKIEISPGSNGAETRQDQHHRKEIGRTLGVVGGGNEPFRHQKIPVRKWI